MIADTVDLALTPWRCGNCGARGPVLGLVTALGAVHLLHGRRAGAGRSRSYHPCPIARHTILDLATGAVAVHCSACHVWRQLRFDRKTEQFIEGPWTGYQPGPCVPAGSAAAAAG